MPQKRPEDWSPENKLKAVLEAASLYNEQLCAFLRRKEREAYLKNPSNDFSKAWSSI